MAFNLQTLKYRPLPRARGNRGFFGQQFRVLSAVAATLSIGLSVLSLAAFGSDPASSDLENTLRAKYVQKVMRLRGFCLDGRLHFDSKGGVVGRVHPGAWTLSSVGIKKVKVSADKVELSGSRLAEMYDPKQMKFMLVRADKDVRIVVDRDATQPDTAVINSIAHVFVSEGDRLIDLVPEYWKPWVAGEFEMVPQEGLPDCQRFKGRAQRTVDGGVFIPCEEHAKTKGLGQQVFDPAFLPYRLVKASPRRKRYLRLTRNMSNSPDYLSCKGQQSWSLPSALTAIQWTSSSPGHLGSVSTIKP